MRSTGHVPKQLLSPEQESEVAGWVCRGPDLAEHGVVRWRRANLARAIEASFGVVLAERSLITVLRRLAFRGTVARPRHAGQYAGRQASFRTTSPPRQTQPCPSTPAASRWSSGGSTKPASASRAR